MKKETKLGGQDKHSNEKLATVSLVNYFPNEVMFNIIKYLPLKDLLTLEATSKYFSIFEEFKLDKIKKEINDAFAVKIGVIPTEDVMKKGEGEKIIEDNKDVFSHDDKLVKKMIESFGIRVELIKLETVTDIESKEIDILLLPFNDGLRMKCEDVLNEKKGGFMCVSPIKNVFFKAGGSLESPIPYGTGDKKALSCMHRHVLNLSNTFIREGYANNNALPHVLLVNYDDLKLKKESDEVKEDFSWVERWSPDRNGVFKLTYLNKEALQSPEKVLLENAWLKNLIGNVKKEIKISKNIFSLKEKYKAPLSELICQYEKEINENPKKNSFFKKSGLTDRVSKLTLLRLMDKVLKNYLLHDVKSISIIIESFGKSNIFFGFLKSDASKLLKEIVDEYSKITNPANIEELANDQQNFSKGM